MCYLNRTTSRATDSGTWIASADSPTYPPLKGESGHAISFMLALVAFCALLWTAFVDARPDAMQRRGWDRPAALVDEA
jgi:hypothetical protein